MMISWMTLLTRQCVSAQETPARGESGADNEVQLARCPPGHCGADLLTVQSYSGPGFN